ncbi:hypothetical protein OCU04_000921 [Sclerotinia nivalis]|uniref:Uncharacterized protein n=1 Tax=Sclerotinia nivalis TaxID=352851 RepID=A0A9X0DQQ2_9HELO|nr:hypothetical protein OCU04_000921 [Sclerotinia nivalis]
MSDDQTERAYFRCVADPRFLQTEHGLPNEEFVGIPHIGMPFGALFNVAPPAPTYDQRFLQNNLFILEY